SLLSMLLGVYSLYVPAVVPVTAVALLFAQKREIQPGWFVVAMIIGSISGVLSLTGLFSWLKPDKIIAVYGTLGALLVALGGVLIGQKRVSKGKSM
ncbi:MAG: hypothetical protein ACK4HQ_03380, partial [Brevinematales bacterium]